MTQKKNRRYLGKGRSSRTYLSNFSRFSSLPIEAKKSKKKTISTYNGNTRGRPKGAEAELQRSSAMQMHSDILPRRTEGVPGICTLSLLEQRVTKENNSWDMHASLLEQRVPRRTICC
jgi:hypothetical protein